jgi:hypothetical protein
MQPYWTAFGVALHALGKVARPISLLPPEARAERARALAWQKVQAANLGLILLVFLALGLGTWRHWQSIQQKEQLISETQTALLTAKTLSLLSQRLDAEYELIRPVLQRQRQTVETLRTLAAVQEVRTNNDFWYLLFADPVSYFAGATLPGAALSPTNLATSLFSTNLAPGWREFVAELCIPADGDAQRRTLSSVVTNLKLSPLFVRVDELPAERKRSVVDPKVTISNKVFGIAIEVAPTLASPAAREPRAAAPRPAAPPPKSSVAGPARTNRPASAPAPASRPATNLPPARR